MELVTFTPLYHHNIHALVLNWSPLHHCSIIISMHWYGTGHLYPLYHHNIHALVWNWSPLHHCIIIISMHWYGTGHLHTIVSSLYPFTGMELVTSTPLYHHNIHSLVLNWSPIHHCVITMHWSPLHHCIIIISMHWFMMIQWCKGDQFHTSAWILWWYNGVKVTSALWWHNGV